jgi:hypothetical protein
MQILEEPKKLTNADRLAIADATMQKIVLALAAGLHIRSGTPQ